MSQNSLKWGFTLGKFAPFHKGHEWLVCKALEQVDHLVVVIYPCDELAHISLHTRANWIRTLFPQVHVIEAIEGPKVQGYTQQVIDIQNQYLSRLLEAYNFDYFFSSEAYGDHVSKALNCTDVRIDMSRMSVPISGTEIRRNIWCKHVQYRSFIADEVYKDLVSKIVFLGAPSTGKSTLCRALADKYQTLWVSEYGRDYWLEHQIDRRLSPQQLLHIAQTQVEMEDQMVIQANQYLFCDTNAFTTWHFALHYHNQALPELEVLAQQSWQRYALVVLCDDDIAYDDTWERSGDTNRHDFQGFIKRYLESHKIPYLLVSGSVDHRILMIEEKMRELNQFVTAN